jgi:hypothetical protein
MQTVHWILDSLSSQNSRPYVWAAIVAGFFTWLAQATTKEARQELSEWLLGADLSTAASLPGGTLKLFYRSFGRYHFSVKCIAVSASATLICVGLAFALGGSHDLYESIAAVVAGGKADAFKKTVGVILVVWAIVCIPLDYATLWKTRFALRLLARRGRRAKVSWVVPVLIVDLLVSVVMFAATLLLVFILASYVVGTPMVSNGTHTVATEIPIRTHLSDAFGVGPLVVNRVVKNAPTPLPTEAVVQRVLVEQNRLELALLIASLVPSLWLWLFVSASWLAKLLLHLNGGYLKARRWLDIENQPFFIAGSVACAAVFAILWIFEASTHSL